MRFFLSQTAPAPSRGIPVFLRPSDSLRVFNSRQDHTDRSDQNV